MRGLYFWGQRGHEDNRVKAIRAFTLATEIDPTLNLPDSFLRDPRYHEYWAQPGMVELAAERRANGQIAGLPLPIEGE